MDPNANLVEMLRLATSLGTEECCEYTSTEQKEADAERLAELVLVLDEWIRKGGAVPARWLIGRIEASGDLTPTPKCGAPRLMKDRVGGGHSVVRCVDEAGHDGPHTVEVP